MVNGFGIRAIALLAAAALCLIAQPAAAQDYAGLAGLFPIQPVTDLGTFTVATQPVCDTTTAKKTAWFSDLFGQTPGDRVVCDGVGHWKPVRPLAVSMTPSSNLTLDALTSAPTIIMNGTVGLGVTYTMSLSTTYAYQGAEKCIVRKTTGLGTIVLSITALALGNWTCYQFDGAAWVQTKSGGLL